MTEFLENNWKWIIGSILTIIGLIIAYFQLRQKEQTTNSQKSGKNSINIQSSKNIKIGKDDKKIKSKKRK
ncbi:hypothetical protein MK851_15040 [Tenacibaculum sp. 1B UA]|uniref:hypothetical protein n=1 Tax=Tenacibaculum sp. 1B UA TaxID=2922252 RepID=UPI002A23EA4D|nr:hypothetical protein [Tenacibaculum sp. 1B UA]MDX8554929.1 hypothetical protein [Tenacibaculum sp. 1B UA]